MHARDNATTARPQRGRAPALGKTPPPGLMARQAAAGSGNAAVVQMLREAGHPWAQEQAQAPGRTQGQAQEPDRGQDQEQDQHRHGAGCGHGRQAESPARSPAVQRTALQHPAAQHPTVQHPTVQRLAIDDAPSSWHGEAVRRSGEGVDGVFFVGGPGAEVVVKPLASTGSVEYAHRFLEHMNIRAPRIVRHAVDSPAGQAIRTLLLNNQGVGRNPDEIANQLATAQAFLVMETAPGATLQSMDAGAAVQYLRDDAALRQTGRSMVADAFLGNTDRIVGGRVNLGNFLYQAAAQLTAIDNDSRFAAPSVRVGSSGRKRLDDTLDAKLGYIRMLRGPAHANPFIGAFLTKFRAAHHDRPEVTGILDDRTQADRIRDRLGEGVTAAFADLATVFTEHALLLRAIGSSAYDEASAPNRSVSGAKAAAKYVADTQNGLTHDEAVDSLVAYVERRVAKDKLPTGLKWLAQLTA